jgi:hypothetical protein
VERRPNTRLWVFAAVVVTLVVALLPALIAYRYTAPDQRGDFVSHPWRGWSFAAAALAVPGDSELKTAGVDPSEVQLLFVTADEPYHFSQDVGGIHAGVEVTPSYRFIWEVRGTVPTAVGPSAVHETAVVALLDYETGRLLYDVRADLPAGWLESPASPSTTPSPSSP